MILHPRLIALTGWFSKSLAVTIALGLALSAAYVVQALLVASALSTIFARGPFAAFVSSLWSIFAVISARAVILWLFEQSQRRTATFVAQRLRERLFTHLAALGPSYLAGQRTGQVAATVIDVVESLEPYYSKYLPQVAVTVIVAAALVSVMAHIDVHCALVAGVFALFVPFAPRLWDTTLARRARKCWDAHAAVGAEYIDTAQGLSTLKLFGASEQWRKQLVTKTQDLYRATMHEMGITLADTGLTYFGIVGGAAAVAGVAAIDVAAGRLNVSNAFLLMLLGTECFRSFSILGGYWHTGYRGIAAINDLSAILEIQNPAPIERPSAALSSTSAISRHEDTGCSAVAFDHVAFAYPGAAGPVVRDVTFAVQPGERFAIVGPSGAGKSTLIGLLLRLLEPQGGAVSVFGARAQERPLNDHRAFFGIVWQETYLFRSSIAENIRLGRPRATDAEVETAARAARVDEFVQRLPAKYNTLVGERGLTLSGGERQRIALARALLLDAPILVFDEATSNVDALSEALIFEALRELDRTRTVITIAHRFSTIRNAERVLVIEAGRVIEQGTHAELLVRGNAYAGIIAEQCEPA